MAVIITPQNQIDAYFDSDRLSQSKLKLLLKGFNHFLANQQEEKKLYYEEKDYFLIGSGVDTILTGEVGEFEKQYHVSTLESKPSDTEMSIINYVFDELVSNNVEVDMSLQDYPNMLTNSIVEHNWYKGNPGPNRIAGLITRCTPYFEDLKESQGKQILSSQQRHLIHTIVNSLKTNYRTSKYFDRHEQEKIENIDFYYQLPIYFVHEGIECKALLDLLVVVKDAEGRILTLMPVDLKTMYGETVKFINKIRQHRYDIQAVWYRLALYHWMSERNYTMGEFVMDNFKFIVESTSNPGTPLVYQLTNELMKLGDIGRPELTVMGATDSYDNDGNPVNESQISLYPVKFNEIKGVKQLVDEYKFYQDNEWKEDIVLANNEGILKVSWDGIVN